VGTYGAIRVYPTATGFRVRTLYRDFDGQTRPVERKGRRRAQRHVRSSKRCGTGPGPTPGDRLQEQILPALGNVKLRELTVGLVDRHLTTVKAQHGNAIVKTTRIVISGICALATRHDALPTNRCRETQRISCKPKNPPHSLSVQEIQQLPRVPQLRQHCCPQRPRRSRELSDRQWCPHR